MGCAGSEVSSLRFNLSAQVYFPRWSQIERGRQTLSDPKGGAASSLISTPYSIILN
jgi:hypothetical protein